jgi:hypothetical protein
MTLSIPDDVILRVTHLSLNGELVTLFRCPFCSFKNIHEDEITRHIRYKKGSKHNVDVDKLDKKTYIVTKKPGHYTYEKKDDLPLPWIQCLWCDYQDKIERDLEWHFLEKHKSRLNKMMIPADEYYIDSFALSNCSDIECRLQKATKLAKRNGKTDTGG